MATINFGGVEEEVITRDEFPVSTTDSRLLLGKPANSKRIGIEQSTMAGFQAKPFLKLMKL
jgi:hypothetical protein